MPTPKKKPFTPPPASDPRPVRWVEVDFGDTELVVQEFPDGMFAMDLDEKRLLVNGDQMQQVVGAFLRLGKEQGWL
jgi:hypothetical protein